MPKPAGPISLVGLHGELEPVTSAFSIRYNTVLNLWDPPHGNRVRNMLQQSLAQFQSARRVRELLERGLPAHYEDVLTDIRTRDERDSSRSAAPLRQAGTMNQTTP